jgi:hypothetical protein
MSIETAFERLRDANPVPRPELLLGESDDISVVRTLEPWRRDEMDTQTIDRDPATKGTMRKWLLPAIAGAAVVAFLAVGVLISDQEEPPTAQGPVGVAEAFMTAFEEGDLATSGELLAPDANVVHAPATSAADWPSFILWNEAAGFEHLLETCEQPIPADLSTVECSVLIESPWADALGVEIGQEDVYRLRVVDGAVTSLTVRSMNSPAPMTDVWNTFHDWVAENHPDALDVMHTQSGLEDPGLETVALTDESIDRWTQVTELFVADMG